MNLISGTHHSCERREYAFIVLWDYTIISRENISFAILLIFFFFFCFGKYKNIGILKKLDFKKLFILFIRLINKKKNQTSTKYTKKRKRNFTISI